MLPEDAPVRLTNAQLEELDYRKLYAAYSSRGRKSVTDMQTKEDHMRNGQLKPGYNVQIGVNGEYITGIEVFSNRTDYGTMVPFMKTMQQKHGKKYKSATADAGYERFSNYLYLEANVQLSFIKPANYEQQKSSGFKKQIGRMENMFYDAEDNSYTCAQGRKLSLRRECTELQNGRYVTTAWYRCESCSGCPVRDKCCQAKNAEQAKELRVNKTLQELRKASLENITTEHGIYLRQCRSIQAWNGDVASKRKVVRYMREHDRERGTAQWLRDEFGGNLDAFPIRLTGVEQAEIPWRDVQRRMITLLKNDRFFTDQELDNFDDIDPVVIRERLAEAGIVNGEVVDPDALDNNPFIRQVMADVERIAQEDQAVEPSPPQAASEPKKRPGQTRVERNYRAFAQMFPEIVSGEYRYLELRNREDGGLMPLIIQQIGENEIAMSHTYEQYGDLMYDPEMAFRIDTENGTLEPLTFRLDGGLPLYQEVYPEPGRWIPRLRNDLSAFTDQWLKNIEMQGRIRTRSIAEIDGENVEFSFDEHGNPVRSERTEQNIQDGQFTEITPTDTPAEPFAESITLADGTTYAVGDTVTIDFRAFSGAENHQSFLCAGQIPADLPETGLHIIYQFLGRAFHWTVHNDSCRADRLDVPF